MNRICYYLLITMFLLQGCGETTHPDLKLFHLKGKVKSLSYDISQYSRNYYPCGTIDIYFGEHYVYEFNKKGEWINPKEDVSRNSNGYITGLDNRQITWDSKGRLLKRLDCDTDSEDEPCSGMECYYNSENVVDSLWEIQPGADAEFIHRYNYGDIDEFGNWIYADVEIVDISRDAMRVDGFTVTRNIAYWSEEDLIEDEHKEPSYDSSNDNPKEEYNQLKNVLRNIAGTYEIYENRGIQGLHTWCILKISSDGTGVKIEEDGTRTNILSTHLNSDNTISLSLSDGSGERYRYDSFSGSLDFINPRMYNGIVIDGIRKR